jgi:serine/threonine-protein kinase
MIGRGATGEVYAGTHAMARTQAAVKVLISSNRNRLERFQRELDIATRLRAPGLVEVYEAGMLDGDVPFLVMELLRGHDLGWHLRRVGQLDVPDAIELCDQVTAALGAAHAGRIVHRDLKPQNLFLDGTTWKILDFGMSRLRDSRGTLTNNAIIGTPGYMAPEQARAHAADERSDLFSLGAVLYRSVTGQPPFRGRDTPQLLFDVVYRAPRRPTDLVRSLPADLDLFFALALAKRPDDRFASTAALASAFRDASSNRLDDELRDYAHTLLEELPWRGTATTGVIACGAQTRSVS